MHPHGEVVVLVERADWLEAPIIASLVGCSLFDVIWLTRLTMIYLLGEINALVIVVLRTGVHAGESVLLLELVLMLVKLLLRRGL
jgi:hypothetical protein